MRKIMRTQTLGVLFLSALIAMRAPLGFAQVEIASIEPTASPTPPETTSVTLTTEGVSGDMDKKRRSPSISATSVVGGENVKVLVDAYVPAAEYQKYPIQFDFYVNRHFFTSLIRSPELTGAIGIEVPPSVAVPPFNYMIVAKVLHPNRVFTSTLVAAVFAHNLSAQLNCTLTLDAANEETKDEFSAEEVQTTQSENSKVTLAFNGQPTEGDEVPVSADLTLTDTALSGTVSFTRDGVKTTLNMSGDATFGTGGSLSELSVSTSDGTTTLVCS
jgi:hypothetical protein